MTLRIACCFAAVLSLVGWPVCAEVTLPSLFTDHMVLQRDIPCPIWGKSVPHEEVTVIFAGQERKTTAGEDGRWRVTLAAMDAASGQELLVLGENKLTVQDVAVGEVWVCSGQSNMGFTVGASFNAALNASSAKNTDIRLLTVVPIGEQTPQDDFPGEWERANSDTVRGFSAVGYLFGKRLYETLNVPIGLIDNAWGGSACEAWVPQDKLSDQAMYGPLMQRWRDIEAKEDETKQRAAYKKKYDAWYAKAMQAKAAGKRMGTPPTAREALLSRHRPGNLYNARVAPLATYGIRGAIWYQGESNASRAEQHREMFPLMIQCWRDAWRQGDFPFYWVQLADFRAESSGPRESDWAELRESQTMTLERLPNTGEAVIIDIGEGNDIHPRNKQEVANRLARIALAKDYGFKMTHNSPRVKGATFSDGKAEVTFEHVGRGLMAFDTREVRGFVIAGEDKKWHPAQAKITGRNKVVVSSDSVPEPVAVRYAWADNPVCNLYSRTGLPATPFRTDDWPGVTTGKR